MANGSRRFKTEKSDDFSEDERPLVFRPGGPENNRICLQLIRYGNLKIKLIAKKVSAVVSDFVSGGV